MFTSTVRTLRATTLMLSKPRIASCSIYKSLDFYIHLHATEHRARQLTGPSPKKPIQSSIPPSWSSRPDIIVVIRIWYNIMSSYDMCYCMSLMLHLSRTFHHVSTYDFALWDISPRCSIILWILFILMRTWLVWLIFTALEVHSVIGCAPRVLQSIQHTTAELAKFLSFGQHQKLPRCFQNPNKKDKF